MHSPQEASETASILDDLRRIVQALRESSRASERATGLSGAQLFALATIAEATDPLSVNDLATRTRTHQSSVSVVVQRLVGAGLVRRVTSPRDARRRELAVTARGRAALRRAPDAAQAQLITGIEGLPRATRLTLARALRHLAATMRLGAAAPAMFFEERAMRGLRRG
jgi:DNA-binding MarR family transcriptional regulator